MENVRQRRGTDAADFTAEQVLSNKGSNELGEFCFVLFFKFISLAGSWRNANVRIVQTTPSIRYQSALSSFEMSQQNNYEILHSAWQPGRGGPVLK